MNLTNVSKKNVVIILIFIIAFSLITFGSNKIAGTLKWKCNIGPIYSSPAIAKNGTIYVGNLEGYLYAVNTNGKVKWSYETGGAIFSSPAIGKNGIVYFGSNDGFLYALTSTGKLKWRHLFSTNEYVKSSPAIGNDGIIYVGCGNNFYALSSNGTLKWTFRTNGNILSSPAIGANNTIYFGSNDGYLYAINSNGTLKWKFRVGKTFFSSPAIGKNGVIYIGNSDGTLYAVNSNGTLKWKFNSMSEHTCSSVSIGLGPFGEKIYFSSGSYLYALGPNGQLEWKYKIFSNYSLPSSPLVAEKSEWERTILIGGGTLLWAITPFGLWKWIYDTQMNIHSSPAVGSDGTIYVGSMSGYLYAINSLNKALANSAWPKFRHDNFNSGYILTKNNVR